MSCPCTRAAVLVASIASLLVAAPIAGADQVTADDQIVQGSMCLGFDCVNNEVFDVPGEVRLKENNTRIHLEDTSAGDPDNDWELSANESASGSTSVFQIIDRTAGWAVLRIIAAARDSALVATVDGSVSVGPGTLLQLAEDGVSTENPAPVVNDDVLADVRTLAFSTWNAPGDGSAARRIGVDGAAFSSVIGVGSGGAVAVSDIAGTALSALIALDADVQAATPGATGPAGDAGLRGPRGFVGLRGQMGMPGAGSSDEFRSLMARLDRLAADQSETERATSGVSRRAQRVAAELAALEEG